MSYTPKHLHRWTSPDCYFGAAWPDYYSSGFGKSRDSDALERSNFRTCLKALGGESDTVLVIRESHWAVGWVEWIAIHQDNEQALREADLLRESYEEYPALNEDDWSNEEQEEASRVWSEFYSDKQRIAYMRDNRSQFEFYDYADLIGCARGRYFSGYASELLC